MNDKIKQSVRIWLKFGIFLVSLMILLGGATRLTGSGLSMVSWDLVWGIFPPMSQEAWDVFFDAYKQSPEYLKINFSMTVDEFKNIFWLEYAHRVMGRILGIYFLFPLFLGLNRKRTVQLMIGFVLVLLQGVWGWVMVKSGLKNIPHVDPFFLSGHLMLASFLVLWMIWEHEGRPRVTKTTVICIGILLVEIFLGGLVAGFKAGHIYNTFPLMDGRWFPYEVSTVTDLLIRAEGVQWLHRVWAVVVLCDVIYLSVFIKNKWILFCLIVQIFLGIVVLLLRVPLFLGLLHQLNAFILLGLGTFLIFIKKNA